MFYLILVSKCFPASKKVLTVNYKKANETNKQLMVRLKQEEKE